MADATGRLAGRTAVVTGAASGIGAGIAVAFAREGADVAVVDLVSEPDAAPVLGAIRERGRRALFVRTDVADDQGVRAMAGRVLEEFGHVDVLVNNAGIFTQSLLEDMPVEDWDRVLSVNLRGPFLCTRALIGPDARARLRAHHQRRLPTGPDRWRRGRALQREQGRFDRPDQGPGPRGVRTRSPGQCNRSRADPDSTAGRGDRGVAPRQTRRAAHAEGSERSRR